jgi:hypothetical protein
MAIFNILLICFLNFFNSNQSQFKLKILAKSLYNMILFTGIGHFVLLLAGAPLMM